MPKSDVVSILLFAEDHGHRRATERLADRVLCESAIDDRPNWVTHDIVHSLRSWQGAREGEPFTRFSSLDALSRELRLTRLHGKFDGAPGAADAKMCRKALLIAQKLDRHDAVVIARDLDQERTRQGFEQARAEQAAWPFEVLFAGAQPEVEAWSIAGFEPRDENERQRLAGLRQRLGFDPTTSAHELGSTAAQSAKDAKKVLDELTAGHPERQSACLEADLVLLRRRGGDCGLAAFLDDVERTLVPLVHGRTGNDR